MAASSKIELQPSGLPPLPSACEPLRCPPWAESLWQGLYRQHIENRLHHAVLISGAPGIGKAWFGEFLARALLCEARQADGPCAQCPSCHQFEAGTLPDFHAVPAEGAGERIKVDAVRQLIDWLHLTANRPAPAYRLALMLRADTLNRSGANSLLKTLEEPGEAGRLILIADRPANLPATVRSRCQQLRLKVESEAAALSWLEQFGDLDDPAAALRLAHGAPVEALSTGSDAWQQNELMLSRCWQDLWLGRASIGRLVEQLKEIGTERTLVTFLGYSVDAIHSRLGIPRKSATGSQDADTAVIEQSLSLENWFTVHDRILHLYRIDDASFQPQAVLEGLLADIRHMSSKTSPAP